MGFVPEILDYRGCQITIFDLGGGVKIRPVWSKYFAEVHGIIFVIDSSAPGRVQECKGVLTALLQHRRVAGKPILILANKQDVEGAMDEIDILETLQIEALVNQFKCPTRLETCSAITLVNKKPDKPIADGFRWLIDTIVVHYDAIHSRVEKDMEKERERAKKELEEIKARIRVRRAEREQQGEPDRKQLEEDIEDIEDMDQESGDVVVADTAASVTQVSSSVASTAAPDASAAPTAHQELDPLSSEAEELRELGFQSLVSLAATTTDTDTEGLSSDQQSPQLLQLTNSASRGGGQRVSSVLGSPSLQVHRSDSGQAADNTSHRIIVVSSPTSSSPSRTTVVSPYSPRDSGFPSTPATTTPHAVVNGSVPLRLGSEEQESPRGAGESVPIDSDDDLYDMDLRPTGAAHRSASVTSYVRDQLELESSFDQAPRKKSFLKRYHKTAPAEDGLVT